MAMLVTLFYSLLLCLHHVRYQATSVADTFQTLGYLVPIIASLCICIMPRARFIEMMLLNTVYYTSCLNEIKTDLLVQASTALAYAFSLLCGYCALQARWHSLSAGENAAVNEELAAAASSGAIANLKELPYNSSAAVVCAIWLIFHMW
jgi:hypothetical protein